ncbi:MAG: hypothetical protein JKX68_12080 [Flavobacteriales bacterium]|nr:hypothetical protein [Flavobacteriales bacterium]
MIILIIYLAILALMIASGWKIYVKAGHPGWAALVPIYNLIVLCKIIGKPTWWVVLCFIPLVNYVILIMMIHGLSKSFGKGAGYTVGLVFLGFIFYPMLAFGDAQYIGNGGEATSGSGEALDSMVTDGGGDTSAQ